MNRPKPDILFFPFGLLSHYTRSIEWARQLEPSARIAFKSSRRYDHLVRSAGFTTFDSKDFDAEYVNQCMRRFSFRWINESDLQSIYEDQVKVIEQLKPALVIGDMAPTLKMACEKTRTRFVSLINGYMSKYYALTRPVGETHPAYFIKKLIPADIFDRIAIRQEKKAFGKIHRPFRNLRKKYGLEPKESYLDELEGDETLICDHEHVFPLSGKPDSYRFVGPLLPTGERPSAGELSATGGKKTILVTMGSSGDWTKLASLNEARFSKYHFNVLGDKDRILSARHFQHFDFVDFRSALAETDLAICHGGNGTLNYCYEMKVPFIALPSMVEQEWNALRFQEIMPGQVLPRRPSFRKLEETIDLLITIKN